MEPLAALALAGNVVQFIEFSSKIISLAQETDNRQEIETALNDIEYFQKSIQERFGLLENSVDGDDSELWRIYRECSELADDIQLYITSIQAKGNTTLKWSAFFSQKREKELIQRTRKLQLDINIELERNIR